jgi:hypothetical protein
MWKILKHYTDSGTSTVCPVNCTPPFTYAAELSMIIEALTVITFKCTSLMTISKCACMWPCITPHYPGMGDFKAPITDAHWLT